MESLFEKPLIIYSLFLDCHYPLYHIMPVILQFQKTTQILFSILVTQVRILSTVLSCPSCNFPSWYHISNCYR